ncbi:hypothetical protein DPM19_06905 [Actinomadura craniellae]|uniref:Uncharacterized protein n=2 Tax=Actinomadura craniellae TaxID=2231787 RepID=A0A365H8U5_9ACTN|nr:hypothetical protein DPM19_06905 [Actinomadura craniellae]
MAGAARAMAEAAKIMDAAARALAKQAGSGPARPATRRPAARKPAAKPATRPAAKPKAKRGTGRMKPPAPAGLLPSRSEPMRPDSGFLAGVTSNNENRSR